MNKMLSLSLVAFIAGTSAFAQTNNLKPHTAHALHAANSAALRGTEIGDTTQISNLDANASPVNFTVISTTDSGYLYGTNVYGDKGFAERFDFSAADSAVQVIGMGAYFTGRYNANTTKTVNLKVWAAGPRTAVTGVPNYYYSGLPTTVLAQRNVSIKNLGIANGVGNDTIKAFLFTTPTSRLGGSFFVGYDIDYNFRALAGDTINLISSDDGDRTSDLFTVQGADTTINVQNAVQWDDNTWYDELFENSGISHDFYIFPIVVRSRTLDLPAIKKNELTFFGAYPNPASNSANIKFALNKEADITLYVMDLAGRILQKTEQSKQGTGEHIISVNTEALASGEYIYMLRTSNGAAVGSKLTVKH